jgi:ribonuclease PH
MFIDEITGEKYIDLNSLTNNFEIPIQNLIQQKAEAINKDEFLFQETVVNDSSASIRYSQFGCKMLIEIFGPREVKYREKMKTDSAIVETYIKLNHEFNKESKFNLNLELKNYNSLIQNFCTSLIFLEAYPRCQINFVIHVLTYSNETMVNVLII